MNVSANCRFAFSFPLLPRIIAGERASSRAVYVPYFAPLLFPLPAGIFFFLLLAAVSSSFVVCPVSPVRSNVCSLSLKLLLPLAIFRIHGIATFPASMTSGEPLSTIAKNPFLGGFQRKRVVTKLPRTFLWNVCRLYNVATLYLAH